MKKHLYPTAILAAIVSNGVISAAVLAQSVVNVVPSNNADNVPANTLIAGSLKASNNITIPTNTVKIFLDGKDVTRQSGINNAAFSYRPPQNLKPGKHTARVEFVGSDGLARFVTWDFNVAAANQPKLEVTQITHNSGQGLKAGEVFEATLRGTPSQTARVLIVQADRSGKAIQEISATEISTGVYKTSFTVSRVALEEGIVIGRLANQEKVAYAIAKRPAKFNVTEQTAASDPSTQVNNTPTTQVNNPATPTTQVKLSPTFTSHKNGELIQSRRGFTLTGTTQPGATVAVKVSSSSRNFGNILGSILAGNVLVDRSIKADSQGNFSVDVPKPLVINKGMKYRVEAIADNNGTTSQPVNLELIQN